MMRRLCASPLLAAALAVTAVFGGFAAFAEPAAAQDIAFRGFGVRAGAGFSPGQFVGGFQLNLGEFVPRLRFQPDLEVGAGGGQTSVDVTAPVYYRIPIDARTTFYAGGGITLGSIDQGHHRGSEFLVEPAAAVGLEWPAASGQVFGQITATGGDFNRLKLVAGWNF
jgi:hypothetical protein